MNLSAPGNGILWIFTKSFMKLDAVIILVFQREKKNTGVQKW